MKLEWMRVFLEIAETGSMNKAAENLYLTQPAITKNIHALEKELAQELFLRKKTGVELTEAGELFLPYAREIIQKFEQYRIKQRELLDAQAEQPDAIELAVSTMILQSYYRALTNCLDKDFPKMKFYFIESAPLETIDLIQNNEAMLGLIAFSKELGYEIPIPDELNFELLYQSPSVCCVNTNSKYARYKVMPNELQESENMISLGLSKQWLSAEFLSQQRHSQSVSNLEIIRNRILHDNDAYIFLPECIAKQLFQQDKVVYLSIEQESDIVFGLLYQKQVVKKNLYSEGFLHQFSTRLKGILQDN